MTAIFITPTHKREDVAGNTTAVSLLDRPYSLEKGNEPWTAGDGTRGLPVAKGPASRTSASITRRAATISQIWYIFGGGWWEAIARWIVSRKDRRGCSVHIAKVVSPQHIIIVCARKAGRWSRP